MMETDNDLLDIPDFLKVTPEREAQAKQATADAEAAEEAAAAEATRRRRDKRRRAERNLEKRQAEIRARHDRKRRVRERREEKINNRLAIENAVKFGVAETCGQIVKATGIDVGDVRPALRYLIKHGRLSKAGTFRYCQ